MLTLKKREIEKIQFAISLANNEKYINKFINYFNLSADIIAGINKIFDHNIQDYSKLSRLRKGFIDNYDYFMGSKAGKKINEMAQKLIFNLAIEVNIDESFIKSYANFDGLKSYEYWLSSGVYLFVPPNSEMLKLLKNFEATPKFIAQIILGRLIADTYKKPFEIDEDKKFQLETISKSEFFDADFYKTVNQDISISNIDPLLHYVVQGYKEGRNPSFIFDNNFYLDNNPDVKAANVNPLYHYLVSGKKEARTIRSLSQQYQLSLSMNVNIPSAETVNEAWPEFENINVAYDYLIFTHDNYRLRNGGIQKVIQEELSGSKSFISIFPTKNSEIIGVYDSITKNNYIARLEFLELMAPNFKKIIVHSFINYDHALLLKSPIFLRAKKIYLWAHDYSLLCGNWLLLRNNVESCGAPPLDSTSCDICVYKSSREFISNFTNEFLKKFGKITKIITPSEYSKGVISRGLNIDSKNITVRNHLSVLNPRKTLSVSRKSIRVAYAGSSQLHKGLGVFLRCMESNPSNEYYIFSSEAFHVPKAKYVKISIGSENGLTALLNSHGIDILILPSLWEETYCLVAYEGLSAGAKIFCLEGSGNLAELASISKDVFVYSSAEEMVIGIQNYCDKSVIDKRFYKIKNNMNLSYAI